MCAHDITPEGLPDTVLSEFGVICDVGAKMGHLWDFSSALRCPVPASAGRRPALQCISASQWQAFGWHSSAQCRPDGRPGPSCRPECAAAADDRTKRRRCRRSRPECQQLILSHIIAASYLPAQGERSVELQRASATQCRTAQREAGKGRVERVDNWGLALGAA